MEPQIKIVRRLHFDNQIAAKLQYVFFIQMNQCLRLRRNIMIYRLITLDVINFTEHDVICVNINYMLQ